MHNYQFVYRITYTCTEHEIPELDQSVNFGRGQVSLLNVRSRYIFLYCFQVSWVSALVQLPVTLSSTVTCTLVCNWF